MAHIPDLISLLCLDPKYSLSPYGGQHRTILISRDFTNNGDFLLNNLLQHFAKKEPDASILLVTLSHDWSNYSSIAAKCGSNLRRSETNGNIDVLNVMKEYLNSISRGQSFNACQFISDSTSEFIRGHSMKSDDGKTSDGKLRPIHVIVDDISILLSIGSKHNDVFKLFCLINNIMRDRSKELRKDRLSHLIVQTLTSNSKFTPSGPNGDNLNHLVMNIENLCDLSITLKTLETGYSMKVDGTIKIVDNRLKSLNLPPKSSIAQLLPNTAMVSGDVGSKRAFFFKVGDRRVRLTTSALIF